MTPFTRTTKITCVGLLNCGTGDSQYAMPFAIGKGARAKEASLPIEPPVDPERPHEPVSLPQVAIGQIQFWLYRKKLYRVEGTAASDEIGPRIKHLAITQQKELQRIKREVDAFENLESLPTACRERIPESVRLFVWKRERGAVYDAAAMKTGVRPHYAHRRGRFKYRAQHPTTL